MAEKKGGGTVIARDFQYYRPDSAEEAAKTYKELESLGKKPLYYGGGTEIITMLRAGSLHCGAVIDIKGIKECRQIEFCDDTLFIGAGVTLTEIDESKKFPALGATGARIADHTVQGKITLGGNLSGTIIYREASLPLLLCDAVASVADLDGTFDVPLKDVFTGGRLTLKNGGFLVGIKVERPYTEAPWFHVKRTKMEEIGYPLLTLLALRLQNRLRLAASGMYKTPVRLSALEEEMATKGTPLAERVSGGLERLSPGILDDQNGSATYRRFIMGKVLKDCLMKIGED